MFTFQEIIKNLQNFWTDQGCILSQGHDNETGAGTFNPETFLRCLGPEPYKTCNVEISKRPTDGRYGKNPNRLQKFHQFQVMIKPSLPDMQKLYLNSLEAIGLNPKEHDFRFVHDDWESPTQGAWGLGWEVWCDGMEITQFTYFQSVGGYEVKPVVAELAYGLERIAMFLQGVDNVYKIKYNDTLSYGDVFFQSEVQNCYYNFEEADVTMWQKHFEDFETETKKLLKKNLPIPAYDFAIKASHAFNILDARSAISTTARVELMHRIRDLSKQVAEKYLEEREKLNFPLLIDKKREEKPVNNFSFPTLFSNSKKNDFLLEIGSEELPATFVPSGMIQLEKAICKLFKEKKINVDSIKIYGTPRRLSIYATGIPKKTSTEIIKRKGPALEVAFDTNGNLTKQGSGFFKSLGIDGITKQSIESGKHPEITIQNKTHLFATIQKPGTAVLDILKESLPKLIINLPFPKSMRWEDYDVTYARPIRWIVALMGKNIIPFTIAGVNSSNISLGHSQLSPLPIKITHPNKYVAKLRSANVLVCPDERSASIGNQLNAFEKKLSCTVINREAVLTENLFLSEWPTLGSYDFDKSFLTLPEELLTSEMIDHQKYFPLRNKQGKITNQFIVTVDKKPTETILKNNQAVLIARLSDGLFLYEQDIKKPLESFNNDLKKVTFHKDLGSVYEKTQRIKKLCTQLGSELNLPPPSRAAKLCKADLATAVVYEFPDLQGTIGKYYALVSGEDEITAQAIEEHWWPLTEGSAIPSSNQGSILALADKLDNLISYMSVGIKPSSSKDPYALRRSAIGIIRILIENKWSCDLSKITTQKEVLDFIILRMKTILLDFGIKSDEVNAVLTKPSYDIYDIYSRAKALHEFRKTSDQFDKLHQIYKRAKGQIASEKEKTFHSKYLKEEAEIELAKCIEKIKPKLEKALPQKDYLDAFNTLSSLNTPLANFFDQVHVLADDPKLRANRIALLQQVFRHANHLVDFNKI